MSRRASGVVFAAFVLVGVVTSSATPAAAQGDVEAKSRAGLLALVGQNKPKDVAKALKPRDGEVFDLLVAATAEDPAALAAAQPILALLPEVEAKGLKVLCDGWIKASPDARKAFALAYGAVRAFERRVVEGTWKPEERAADLAALALRLEAAASPYLRARVAIAAATAEIDAPFASRAAELKAARAELETVGDRRRRAVAEALAAKLLIESGDAEGALAARAAADELLAATGARTKEGPVAELFGVVDVALAEGLLADARPDAALAAATRAKALVKASDARRRLRLATALVDAASDANGPASAVDAALALRSQVVATDDHRALVDGARVVGRALRAADKGEEAAKFTTLCRGRARQIGLPLRGEAELALLLGAAYAVDGKDEAATTAYGAAAEFAAKAGAPALVRIAIGSRAAMLAARKNEEEAAKLLAEAVKSSAGGPTLDRLTSAAIKLALGEAALDGRRLKDAVKWLVEPSAIADELGIAHEALPGRLDVVRGVGGPTVRERLYAGLRELDVGRDFAQFEPVYAALERARYAALTARLPDEGAVDPAYLREWDASPRKIARLARAMRVGLGPPPEADAAEVFAHRRMLKDRAGAQGAFFAMKRFPEIVNLRKARDSVCGPRGAVYGAHVAESGGFAFAFTSEGFLFYSVPENVKLKELCETFAKVANDPASSPEQFVAASGPVWNELVKPVLPVLEQKTRLAVYVDPTLDGLPFEALVPPDAKGPFPGLPYLLTRLSVGRLVAASWAKPGRKETPGSSWLGEPRLVGFAAEDAATLFGAARAFDEKVGPTALATERVALFTEADRAGGRVPARTKSGGAVVFGVGAATRGPDWPFAKAPEIVALSDPPTGADGATDPILAWSASGAKAVVAPTTKLDPALAEALVARTLGLVARQGSGPIEAVSEAQRALLSGSLEIEGKPAKPEWRRPAFFGRLRAYVTSP